MKMLIQERTRCQELTYLKLVLWLGHNMHKVILLKGEGEQSRQGQQDPAFLVRNGASLISFETWRAGEFIPSPRYV